MLITVFIIGIYANLSMVVDQVSRMEQYFLERHPDCSSFEVDPVDHYFRQFICPEVDLWQVPVPGCAGSKDGTVGGGLHFGFGFSGELTALSYGEIPCFTDEGVTKKDTALADALARFHLRYYETLMGDDWFIYTSLEEWRQHDARIQSHHMRKHPAGEQCPIPVVESERTMPGNREEGWMEGPNSCLSRDYWMWSGKTGELYEYRLGVESSARVRTISRVKLASQVGCYGEQRYQPLLDLLTSGLGKECCNWDDSCVLVEEIARPEVFPDLIRFWGIHPCRMTVPSSDSVPTRIFATVADSVAYPITGFGQSRYSELVRSVGCRIPPTMVTGYAEFLADLNKEFEDDDIYAFKSGVRFVEFNKRLYGQGYGSFGDLRPEVALDSIESLIDMADSAYHLRFTEQDLNRVALFVWVSNRGELRHVVYSITDGGQYDLFENTTLSRSVGCVIDK